MTAGRITSGHHSEHEKQNTLIVPVLVAAAGQSAATTSRSLLSLVLPVLLWCASSWHITQEEIEGLDRTQRHMFKNIVVKSTSLLAPLTTLLFEALKN